MKILLWTLLFFSFSCTAETIYKQTDKNGNIVYTDTPQQNAQAVIIPTDSTASISTVPTTIPSPPTKPSEPASASTSTSPSSAPDAPRVAYTTFILAAPADQETFQNQRLIPIKVMIVPDLQSGDKTQLYLDGKPYGSPAEGSDLALNNVDRGSHTVSVVILSKDNTILKSSNSITINVQYARLGPAVP
ncbi:MAG: DUF4124 domain-containing protein [Gammaproteobacteria bacterium]|nr:DUF4124 domain-containing protein [Gammaproteobacteria bacterium]